jgi:TIR domain
LRRDPLVYKFVIEADNWLSEAEIQGLVNQPDLRLKVKSALDALCYHGLIIHDENWVKYRHTGQLFKQWFKDNVLPSLFQSGTSLSSTHVLASPKTVEIFYVYAAQDEELMVELEKQLSLLRKLGLITDWHSGRMNAGSERSREIEQHWNAAQVILLLVSPNFIASDAYEVSRLAMERHNKGTAHVIPILLRPVDRKGVPFEGLQALPTNQIPIVRWRNREAAFLNVAQGIRKVVEQLLMPP